MGEKGPRKRRSRTSRVKRRARRLSCKWMTVPLQKTISKETLMTCTKAMQSVGGILSDRTCGPIQVCKCHRVHTSHDDDNDLSTEELKEKD
jgi:hypothetical protein